MTDTKAPPFTPLKLKLVRPVPSDIEIAQAADIKPITQVADEAAFSPRSSNCTAIM